MKRFRFDVCGDICRGGRRSATAGDSAGGDAGGFRNPDPNTLPLKERNPS